VLVRRRAGPDGARALLAAAQRELSAGRIRELHAGPAARVEALVARGRAKGAFRTDLPVAWMVNVLHAVMHSAAEEIRAGRLTPRNPGSLRDAGGLSCGRSGGEGQCLARGEVRSVPPPMCCRPRRGCLAPARVRCPCSCPRLAASSARAGPGREGYGTEDGRANGPDAQRIPVTLRRSGAGR
jgi:hypothetical protein